MRLYDCSLQSGHHALPSSFPLPTNKHTHTNEQDGNPCSTKVLTASVTAQRWSLCLPCKCEDAAAPPLSHWLLALWNEVPHQSRFEIHHADVYIRIFEYADARTNNIYRRFFPGSFQMTAATRSTSVNGESKSSGRPCMATALRWDRQVRCRASFVTWCS